MWGWLSHLDPNVVLTVVGGAATWLYSKASGKKSESLSSIVTSVLNNLANELLDAYVPANGDVTEYLKKSRKYIEERVWLVLIKRKVPKNSTTIKLVHQATEKATSWLAGEIREIRQRHGNGPVL